MRRDIPALLLPPKNHQLKQRQQQLSASPFLPRSAAPPLMPRPVASKAANTLPHMSPDAARRGSIAPVDGCAMSQSQKSTPPDPADHGLVSPTPARIRSAQQQPSFLRVQPPPPPLTPPACHRFGTHLDLVLVPDGPWHPRPPTTGPGRTTPHAGLGGTRKLAGRLSAAALRAATYRP